MADPHCRRDRRFLAATTAAVASVGGMRTGGGLIPAGDPLCRRRLTVATAQRARRHQVSASAAVAQTTRPRHIWRRAAADARQLLGIELLRDVVGAGPASHPAPHCLAVAD